MAGNVSLNIVASHAVLLYQYRTRRAITLSRMARMVGGMIASVVSTVSRSIPRARMRAFGEFGIAKDGWVQLGLPALADVHLVAGNVARWASSAMAKKIATMFPTFQLLIA